ncbi:hypothetical protein NQ314_008112 [Rhamnusium bicolor]|uniref:Integrase zinc-binding domain-containing protein n=1 Tax=Rhamnusium bicolor TaxID=1586634 RepID=A0AAV8YH61_9CUCU|nr:hypothetical protein NQ314_008112 [Rhamnusium bicolor]
MFGGAKEVTSFPFQSFSCWNKLCRVVAYCLRFLFNCKNIIDNRLLGPLSFNEIKLASLCLVKLSQGESFAEEIAYLKSKGVVGQKSKLINLLPFVHTDNTLTVKGRLENSNYSFDKVHPLILSADHYLTKLLFRYEHCRLLHAGPQLLLSSIRESYWVLSARKLARKTVSNCTKCVRVNPKPFTPLMGNLPARRVTPSPPFYNTDVDYAGPLWIANKKRKGSRLSKCYICIFICFSTKCIHMELVTELSTEAFIITMRRFVARCGKPANMYSDNVLIQANIMEVCATPVTTNSARKRQRNTSNWKRNVAKKLRDAFYRTSDKVSQDAFLLKYCTITQTKRRRPKNGTHASKKFQIYCHVRNDSKDNVLVCQPAFLRILGITKHRLAYVMERFFEHGEAPVERKGGDRKSVLYLQRQNAVMNFINQLKCIESHYCRGESARMYLSSDLNIKKLHRMYSELATDEEKVKESYFQYGEKIKRAVDEETKNKIKTEKNIHKARAAAFFSLLKEKGDGLITLSFDCQKKSCITKGSGPKRILFQAALSLQLHHSYRRFQNEKAPLNVKLELVFPVTGHSFLPPDRVFGNIEAKIRKLEVIENPQVYLDLISESSTVIRMGTDCRIFDWKSSLQQVLKLPGQWHFQFKASKRFYLERSLSGNNILVRGEAHYKNDLNVLKSVTKRGQSVRYINLIDINEGNQQLNPLKLRDVNKLLLKHFGEDWRTAEYLEFYNSIIPITLPDIPDENPKQIEEGSGCEFHPEIPSVLI